MNLNKIKMFLGKKNKSGKIISMHKCFKNLVEESSEGIYICNADTYEILFVNKRLIEILHLKNNHYKSRKCYEYLLHRDKPCEFCKMNEMKENKFCEREFEIKELQKTFILKGKKINWFGVNAHIEYITDDTNRSNALRQMKISDEMMQFALKSSHLHYWQYNIDEDTIYYGNPTNMKIELPAVVKDYSKKCFSTLPVDEVGKNMYIKFREQLYSTDQKEISAELKLFSKGKPLWFKLVCTKIFDESGKLIKVFGTALDITERKLTEERLHEEIKKSNNTKNGMLILGIINLSKNTLILCDSSKNENAPFKIGISWGEVIDELTEQALYDEDIEVIKQYRNITDLANRYKTGNREIDFEYRRKINDSIKWVKTTVNLVENIENRDLMAYIYTVDINDKKIAEEIMSNSVVSDYDNIAYVDGNTEDYIVYMNEPNGRKMPICGRKYSQVIAKMIKKYVVEEERERVGVEKSLSNIMKKLETNKDYFVYYTQIENDGRIRKKKSRYSYLDQEKKRLVISTVDITNIYEEELKRNEILKEALSTAENANKAKSDFLSHISHDIRTPMNAIVGMTELAKESVDDKEKLMEYLKVIDTSSKHLMSMINDILSMTKIENGKLFNSKEKISIHEQVNNVAQIVTPMFNKKNQKFTIKFVDLVDDVVIADGIRITRVVINLLNNASKFTANGGCITLTVQELDKINPKFANFRIIVEDNGVGISSDMLNEVFKPFVSKPLNEGNRDGVGLGLTIAKNIIELNGGTINISSKVNQGTKIWFDMGFMLSEPNDNAAVIKDKYYDISGVSDDLLKDYHVLLIEDNYINQVVAKRMLEKYGASVDVVNDGFSGMERFVNSDKNEYSIIFMDIQMPVMNGYEATKAIRESKHPRAKTIPIIAMSANVFVQDKYNAEKAGMNGFICKPISIRSILKIIDEQEENN